MCGIIGYIGNNKASEIIIDGLKRLEYRGYDSVGIAVMRADGEEIETRKEKGIVSEVASNLEFHTMNGKTGIGHTRWATHGAPCKENSHPHSDCSGKVVLAHNGVIENYIQLKDELTKKGHRFASETDTEVVAHLIEQFRTDGLAPMLAFIRAIAMLKGSYAIVAIVENGDAIYIARKNSPLVVGVGNGETLCASDVPAMLKHTNNFIFLEDGDIGVLTTEGCRMYDIYANEIHRNPVTLNWDIEMAEKGGAAHFMLKEIRDQKHFLYESFLADTERAAELLSKFKKIHIIACGTSYHAACLMKLLLHKHKGASAEAFIASEYPFVAKPDKETLIVAISQSGETADTLQAVRYVKQYDATLLSLTNAFQSSLARISNEVVYLNAGPEVSVAATKTFMSQLAVIYKILFSDDKDNDGGNDHGRSMLNQIPEIVGGMLQQEEQMKTIAETIRNKGSVFFIGRGLSYPIAMEGALKLKEISYIHAEAYPGGELKHGPLSLIENGVPVIVLAPNDETIHKMLGTVKEVKARGAYVIAVTNSEEIARNADITIKLPDAASIDPLVYPFALITPLQFLAYYTSVLKGINPDRPRNLAKSVTVE